YFLLHFASRSSAFVPPERVWSCSTFPPPRRVRGLERRHSTLPKVNRQRASDMGDVTEGPWKENDSTHGAVEFYSGIGGWSEALEGALRRLGREGAFQVRAAYEINLVANQVYAAQGRRPHDSRDDKFMVA
ncbi:hypothetical protein NGA_0319000, partial [Nannochloropsis gaditana CCMP526]|uniref:uncharacterized protein n=1 Tax=Nannochloropsis gaditana (strain CCMP526) TaxID=1093141 RepID=UPI00029F541D